VAQLHPRALGSLFIASYDSQGCGGGILTRLHTGSLRAQEIKKEYIDMPTNLGAYMIDKRISKHKIKTHITCLTPPLWSSGQSSWLQIRRPGFDSRH
jgi:hypothetical protein